MVHPDTEICPIRTGHHLFYLDRMLVSAPEKPLTLTLQLSGAEFGSLGTLFTFGYILSTLFVGFCTDAYRRALILASGCRQGPPKPAFKPKKDRLISRKTADI